MAPPTCSTTSGIYLAGPYGALAGASPPGGDQDEQASIIYNANTGEVGVNAPASTHLTSVNINSDFVINDLTVVGPLESGGGLGDVDLIYVPEPTTLVLLGLGLAGILRLWPRRRP